MRILLLVSRHFRKKEELKTEEVLDETGLPYYQAHNFWYKALKKLGHEVRITIYSGPYPEIDYYSELGGYFLKKFKLPHRPYEITCRLFLPSVHRKQKEILNQAQEFQPQLLLLSGNTDSVFPKTLLEIKKRFKTKLVLLNGLAPVVFATRTEKIMASFFDFIFTNDKYHAIDWLMLGAKRAKALPVSAIDPEIHKPYKLTLSEKRELASDLSFVGSLYPDSLYRDRIEFLEQLTDFNLKIWTPHKDTLTKNKKLRRHYAGEATGLKMFKIFQATKINLNFHGHTMPSGGNMRTFEITGCGGFELVDRINPSWFKIGEEVETFNDSYELREKINYYLKNDRKRARIAKAGHLRTLKAHTYQNRFARMFDILLS